MVPSSAADRAPDDHLDDELFAPQRLVARLDRVVVATDGEQVSVADPTGLLVGPDRVHAAGPVDEQVAVRQEVAGTEQQRIGHLGCDRLQRAVHGVHHEALGLAGRWAVRGDDERAGGRPCLDEEHSVGDLEETDRFGRRG